MTTTAKLESINIWSQINEMSAQFIQSLPMVIFGIVIFVAFFYAARPLSEILVRPIAMLSESVLVKLVARRTISLLIILLGFYILLNLVGLTQFAIAVLSGTGVIGLILGFAFKDIAENFISSLLLSIQKPFQINDVIEVDGEMGVVKQVTARATTLVDFDGDHIQIPNATIYKNTIRNLTANPKMRGNFVIGIGYDSSIVASQKIAQTILANTDSVLADPEPQILVDKLASSTINLKIYFWINGHEHSLPKVSSYLMRVIMREFEKNNISMPDDVREIIFPKGINVIQQNTSENNQANESLPVTKAEHRQKEVCKHIKQDQETTKAADDLSSDVDDIRQQAEQARDPEQGENIL